MKYKKGEWEQEPILQFWCKNIGPSIEDNVWLYTEDKIEVRFWCGVAFLQSAFGDRVVYGTVEEVKQKVDDFLARIDKIKGFW